MCVTQKQIDEGSWPVFTYGGKTYFSVEDLRSDYLAFRHFYGRVLAFKAAYDNLVREFEQDSEDSLGQVRESPWLKR